MMRVAIVCVVLLAAPVFAEFLRTKRTEIAWTGKLPEKTRGEERAKPGARAQRPLLVFVEADFLSKDQERIDTALAGIDQLRLAMKFFDCVKIKLADAKKSHFLSDHKLKAPSLIVYNADRSKFKIAKGRVSAMKAVAAMRAIAQPEYETNIKKTLQRAKVLLGRYDQISDAQNAIDIKTRRYNDAMGKGEKATAAALKKTLDKDIEKRAKYLKQTDALWNKLWTLKRKVKK